MSLHNNKMTSNCFKVFMLKISLLCDICKQAAESESAAEKKMF